MSIYEITMNIIAIRYRCLILRLRFFNDLAIGNTIFQNSEQLSVKFLTKQITVVPYFAS